MSTTDLLIEHLITGIQTAIWILLLSFTFSGIDSALIDFLKANEAVVIFLTMALIYPLGIFVDNLSDKLLDWKNIKIKDQEFDTIGVEKVSVSKVLLYAQDDKLSDFYAYIRMRIRISRSSFFNFVMILLAGGLLLIIRLPASLSPIQPWVMAACLICALIIGLALWSWLNITKRFHNRTAKTYKILKEMGKIS